MESSDNQMEESQCEFNERSTCSNMLKDGSMHLAGLVQECVEVYSFHKSSGQNAGRPELSASRKRKLDQNKLEMSTKDELVDLTTTVVHLKLLLRKWEGLMKLAEERDYHFRLRVLSLSVSLLKFISEARKGFLMEVTKVLEKELPEGSKQNSRVRVCFITMNHLRLLTYAFCCGLNRARVETNGRDVPLLLNLFVDAFDVVIHGVGQNVVIDISVIRDWLFLLTIPWLRKLGDFVPSCQCVPGLNFLCSANIFFDAKIKQRCVGLLRFEGFYPFRNVVRLIFRDIVITEAPDETSVGILEIFSGFWWPLHLFSWEQLLKYYVYLVLQNVSKRPGKNYTVGLTEAVIRLPCAYAYKKIYSDDLPNPVCLPSGCTVCNPIFQDRLWKNTSAKASKISKLKPADERILLSILIKLLNVRSLSVHFQLINVLLTLRKHTKLNLLKFTAIFWKIFSSTNPGVHPTLVDIYGYCTRESKRVVSRISRRSPLLGNSKCENDKSSTGRRILNKWKGSKSEVTKKKSKVSEETSPFGNHSLNNPMQATRKNAKTSTKRTSRDYPNSKTQTQSASKVAGNQIQGARASGSNRGIVFPFFTQKDILTKSKSAFVCKPPAGRFDAGSILYSNFLYKFYLSSSKSSIDELNWMNMVDFHTCFKNWARHADGDIWVAEIIKIILRMLANLNIVNVIILSQRILTCLAMRANCLPWELCARYKEIFAHELKVTCIDSFLHEQHGRKDKQTVIQLCTRYFLRVSIALDLGRKVMTNTFLRPMVKHCVINMFHDQRDNILVAAVCEFVGKSSEEFLEEEFAYYYPNALLNCTPEQVNTLLQKLKQVYTFDPARVIKLNSQFLHIELVSNIFEHRENVLHSYTYLMDWTDEMRNTTSKKILHRSIGDQLEKLYIGIFLHFDAKFRTKAESIFSKRRYLGCFAMLISLLGKKRVTSSKLKLYSMLNSLRTLGPDYNDLLFQAWKQFIYNLEESSLRSMISQICASITFLRKTNGTEVDVILKQVIINHGPVLQDNIRTLHFLENGSGDHDVRDKLKAVASEISPLEFFYQLVEEVGSENSHVRYRAVQRIKQLLEKQIDHIADLKFDDHLFTDSTTKLLKNLLHASKEAKTEKMKVLCASCIGIIGALDPRRFDLKVQLTSNSRFGLTIFTVGEADFVIYFIGEVTKVLRSSVDTRHFDACALCIQEVIKMYGITESESDPIWSRLTPKAKDLLVPLFNSKYSKSESSHESEIPRPIYLSKFGVNLRQWMYRWSMQMTSVMTTERIYNFFNTAMTIVEKSDRIGLVLLPYIASYSLMEGDQEGLDIFLQEVNAVLSHWVGNEKVYEEYRTTRLDAVHSRPENQDLIMTNSGQTQHDPSSQCGNRSVVKEISNEFSYSAAQAAFKVLDHLTRLVRNPRLPQKRFDPNLISQSQIAERHTAARNHTSEAAEPIVKAQKKLRYDVISKAAFACRNFARALMYLEQHLNHKEEDLDRCFGDLQRIYVALFDEDSLKGLESRRKKKITIMEDALNKLAQGKLEPCMPLFEIVVGETPESLVTHQQLVHAYLGLSQFDVGGLLIDGCCSKRTEWKRSFDEALLEISLFQNDSTKMIAKIEELSSEKLSSWGLTISKAFLHFNSSDMDACKKAINKSSLNLISDISSGAAWLDMGFYFRHYQDFIRLQLLTELEETASLVALKSEVSSEKLKKSFEQMQASWDRRIRCAYKSTEVLRPIISFRKLLLEMTKKEFAGDSELISAVNTGIKDCFIKLVKLETALGNFARANQLFLELKLKTSSSVCYEEAKMLFKAGKYDQCLKVLEVGMKQLSESQINQFRKSASSVNISEEQIRFSKGCLLLAQQMDGQKKVDLNRNISNYNYAIEMNKRSEKTYFYMACYYDCLLSQADPSTDLSELHILTVRNFAASLVNGCKYIYQSLPRLLRFWFDYASQNPSSRNVCPETIQELTNSISNLLEFAPTYIFIVAFSQLISRLAHINNVVYGQLKKILAHMIVQHPDQVLWMIISVLKSSYPKRIARCNEIFKLAERQDPTLKSVIRNYKNLADKLISFTMRKTNQTRYTKVSDELPSLAQLIKSKDFSRVLIPFQVFMRPVLPRGGKYVQPENPFPVQLVYISDILEPVQIMASLQKPKRITFRGSDGKSYAMMCKPSDDLRKDAKVMEINNMVQWYMSGDKECRKRNLSVRTYTVTPLSDTCGILEWIPNLHGYRPLITSLIKEVHTPKSFKHQFCDRRDSLAKKKQLFKDVFMANHPIVMSYWFLKSFQDPQSWYMARTSYVKTAAVMSMIGFLMGLGDRHGENILLDSSNGDVVHVDFNCLFNKGETFDWPERVPFRLTRNMLNGMGPLGYEGMFRCCCEIVMKLLRNNSSVFLSIIRPFIFDPLLEWESHINAAVKTNQIGEVNSPKATECLNNIRDRLIGSARNMTKERNVKLSVEAHVNYLINEATKIDNLCQMYIGWGAFL